MRLRVMKNLLEECYRDLELDVSAEGPNFIIAELPKVMSAVKKISDFEFASEEVNNIRNIESVYYSILERVVIEAGTFNFLAKNINALKVKVKTVVEAIGESLPSQSEYSVSIKLPQLSGLDELSACVASLDKALNQVLVSEYINGKVSLQNFDSGSYWIEIVVGGTTALNFVAGLAWSAAVIRKKLYEGDLLKQQIRSLEIKNDSLQEIEEALESQLTLQCETEAKILMSNNNINMDDHEYSRRVLFSIKTLAGLLFKGAEIHHALNAPEEAKNLFPDYAKINQIESKVKQLSQVDNEV